jgi:hypothetical protein
VFASGFLLNGERFFVSRDHVHVYDVRTGLLAGLLQHRGEVQAGAVALDEGLLLLTVGFEKIGRLWDARSLSEVARFSTPDTYPHGAYEITPDRFILWTTRQAIDIWDISEGWLRQTLCGGTLGGLDDQAWQRVGIDPVSADKCAPRERRPP